MSFSPSVGVDSGTSRDASRSTSPMEGKEKINKRHLTPLEKQKLQLEKLLKDPAKPVHIPNGPTEKTLRPPRETMKNVQGSSAGAGSGEFHIYKQSRRREFERLKLMDEKAKEEEEARAFAERQRQRQEATEAKTAKNRAKRLKKRAKAHKGDEDGDAKSRDGASGEGDAKRRKLAAPGQSEGSEFVFKRPGGDNDSDDESDDEEAGDGPRLKIPLPSSNNGDESNNAAAPVLEKPSIMIHDED